jgi:hypothetical protein
MLHHPLLPGREKEEVISADSIWGGAGVMKQGKRKVFFYKDNENRRWKEKGK